MCELHLPEALVKLAERGRITRDDVSYLSQEIHPTGLETFVDAETLLAIDLASHDTCNEWDELLIELISQFAANQVHNIDMVAAWLMRCVSRHGIVDDRRRFDLLMAVIDLLDDVPAELTVLALEQVRLAVCKSEGPLVNGRAEGTREIRLSDVELITTILVNSQSEDRVSLQSYEMQILHEINEGAVPGLHNPAWQRLFMLCVASFAKGEDNRENTRATLFANQSALDSYRLVDTCVDSLRALHEKAQVPFRLDAENNHVDEKEAELLASLTQFLSGVDELQNWQATA